MDKKQTEAVTDRLIKLAVYRVVFDMGEHFTTHAHIAIRRALTRAIAFNSTRDSDLHRLTVDAGFTTEGRYNLPEGDVQNAMVAMKADGIISSFTAKTDRSYSGAYTSWSISLNVPKIEELYKDRIWKRADFIDDKGSLWAGFNDFCKEASARSLMHLARDPSAFIIEVSPRHHSGIVRPADPSLNPARVLNDSSKLRNTLKRAISDHFCESMTLITGTDMQYCLGVGLMTETIYWTPTVEDKTMDRLSTTIKSLASVRDRAEQGFEQMTRLEQLYITHGKGRAFLKWAASELEKVLFDDPGKYIHDRTFGETAKDMLKYMS